MTVYMPSPSSFSKGGLMMLDLFLPELLLAADERAESHYHVPSLLLMENAGKNAAQAILNRFAPEKTVLLAGKGNNGGDAFVVARHLALQGRKVEVLLAAPPESYVDGAAKNLKILFSLDLPCRESHQISDAELARTIGEASLVVDGLLGTGARGAPRGEVRRLISALSGKRPVVALDVPSGVDAAKGEIHEVAVAASVTVTFVASKPGLHIMPGAAAAGEIVVADIGLEAKSLLPSPSSFHACQRTDLTFLSSCHPRTLHKGHRGTVLVVGGSRRYQGAPVLAALGALRGGAGVTALAIPEGNLGAGAAFLPEAVFLPLRQDDGHVVSSSVDELLQWQEQADVMLLGPGLGRSGETRTLVSSLWQNWGKPLIVDGDALWALSEALPSLRHRSDALLTPHEGEAARLLFQEVKAVAKSRLESALSLSRRWGTTLLKGSDTLVTDGEKLYIVSEGGPELAVPGSGDVLGGIIAALIARGQDTVTAAWGGALLHGMAGAALSSEIGQDGCLAREIAEKASILLGHSCHESE